MRNLTIFAVLLSIGVTLANYLQGYSYWRLCIWHIDKWSWYIWMYYILCYWINKKATTYLTNMEVK